MSDDRPPAEPRALQATIAIFNPSSILIHVHTKVMMTNRQKHRQKSETHRTHHHRNLPQVHRRAHAPLLIFVLFDERRSATINRRWVLWDERRWQTILL